MQKEKLIVYLHARDLDHPSWLVVNAEGEITQQINAGDAEELTQMAGNKDIVVIVPAEDVILLNIALPKMSRARLIQAVPYALEEQFIENVDALHFVIGEKQTDGTFAVAVTAKEKMQHWLAQLQTWQLQADALLPLTLALPYAEKTWHVFLQEMCVTRTDLAQGFACDLHNATDFFALSLKQATVMPTHIYLHNFTVQPFATKDHLHADTIAISEECYPSSQFLAALVPQLITPIPLNLLQGRYANKKANFSQIKTTWRVAAYLAATLVGLLFLYPTISYFILQQQVHTIEQQINAIYAENFPLATHIVAPKLRMQEKLHKLTAQPGKNRFFFLLTALGKSMAKIPGIQLQRLDFQNNQLTVLLTVTTSQQLTALNDVLTQLGLKVKQQDATLVDAHINATVMLE